MTPRRTVKSAFELTPAPADIRDEVLAWDWDTPDRLKEAVKEHIRQQEDERERR